MKLSLNSNFHHTKNTVQTMLYSGTTLWLSERAIEGLFSMKSSVEACSVSLHQFRAMNLGSKEEGPDGGTIWIPSSSSSSSSSSPSSSSSSKQCREEPGLREKFNAVALKWRGSHDTSLNTFVQHVLESKFMMIVWYSWHTWPTPPIHIFPQNSYFLGQKKTFGKRN